jgi:hydrogenase nickel incorporation protein HypB
VKIKVLKNVMLKNNALGADNRWEFKKNSVFVLNMTSSPGAGKTTLIKNSLAEFTDKYKMAIIEGDLYTSRDAEQFTDFDIPIYQINTEGGCHLDAKMIHAAIDDLDLNDLDFILIENVGNLVCPAAFDLGADRMVLVYSITEGEDKPKKYATMFEKADIVVINKMDIAPHLNIDVDKVESEIKEVNPGCKVLRLSADKPETLKEWYEWVRKEIESKSKE